MRLATAETQTPTQRSKLTVSDDAYWFTIEPKRVLGYVKSSTKEAGFWIVRLEVGPRKNGAPQRRQQRLGLADDLGFADANGTNVLTYKQAYAIASAWNPVAEEAVKNAFTVRKAIEAHRNYAGKRGNKTERQKLAAYRSLCFNVLREKPAHNGKPGAALPGAKGLGDVALNDLTEKQLLQLRESWIDAANPKSVRSALRKWKDLHSCLEQAKKNKENGITTTAWRELDKMNQDHVARVVNFKNEEALAIIAAARAIDAQVGDYLEGLFDTGARPGDELMALTVGDFNPTLRRLTTKARSEDVAAKSGSRNIALDAYGVALFTRLAAGRPSTAPLLSPDGENHWNVTNDRRRIQSTLVAAIVQVLGEHAPKDENGDIDVVPYAFRHTFISRRLEAGMLPALVAKHCGTSTKMIEKTYGHLCPSEIDRMITETAHQRLTVVKKAA